MNAHNSDRIELFTINQTWYHQHTLHFVIFLVITGLPIMYDELAWIAYMIGVPFSYVQGFTGDEQILFVGMQVCRVVHRAAALLWILVTIPFLFRMLPKIRSWEIFPKRRAGQTMKEVVVEGLVDLKRVYIDYKYPLTTGKYNIAQMLASWVVIAACLIMMASGCVIVFKSVFSYETLELARLLHDIGFALVSLFLLVHIYFAAHPINRIGYKAMFGDGTADLEKTKKKHPGMFQK